MIGGAIELLQKCWAFAQGPIGRVLAAALGAILLTAGIYTAGRHSGVAAERAAERAAEAARLKKAVAHVAAREVTAAEITTGIATKTEAARVEIRWRTQTLIQKVPTYVPPAADAACVVPRGFVRLHDAAAAGVPGPAGGPDQAASGVPLSAVAATVVSNYGAAYDWRAEAVAWRSWYAAQKAAWDKP